MPRRMPIQKEMFSWEGDSTLVSQDSDVLLAMKSAMEAQAWPFIRALAGWDQNNSETGIVHFYETEEGTIDTIAVKAAIRTLEQYMPALRTA